MMNIAKYFGSTYLQAPIVFQTWQIEMQLKRKTQRDPGGCVGRRTRGEHSSDRVTVIFAAALVPGFTKRLSCSSAIIGTETVLKISQIHFQNVYESNCPLFFTFGPDFIDQNINLRRVKCPGRICSSKQKSNTQNMPISKTAKFDAKCAKLMLSAQRNYSVLSNIKSRSPPNDIFQKTDSNKSKSQDSIVDFISFSKLHVSQFISADIIMPPKLVNFSLCHNSKLA